MAEYSINKFTFNGNTYKLLDETSGFSKVSISRKTTSGTNIADITIDGTTTQLYAPTGGGGTGTVTSVGVSNATNGGLSVSGSPVTSSGTITVGHSNVLSSAQTTQAVYPIKIDKNGHISEYGSAVTIPTKVSDLTNDSGFVTTDEKLAISTYSKNSTYRYPILSTAASAASASTKNYTNDFRTDYYTDVFRLYLGDGVDYSGELRLGNTGTNATFTTIAASATSSNRTITLPDASGTIALTSDIPTVTDEKVKNTKIDPSYPAVTYYLSGSQSSSTATEELVKSDVVSVSLVQLTQSANIAELTLGKMNSTGTMGCIRLCGTNGNNTLIQPSSISSFTQIDLPDTTGTLALTSDIPTVPTNVSAFTNDAGYVTTDTKNTAGSTNTSNKIYLIGAQSQADNPQTYSNTNLYYQNGLKSYASAFSTYQYETNINQLTQSIQLSANNTTQSTGTTLIINETDALLNIDTSSDLYTDIVALGWTSDVIAT